ncbi:ammonium transporter [Thiomicrospira microaerophila]|uniref:ammonium transporter n=1 Tax=Thiomicrospira microaerophila TaxID=406020 RepID=UPI00200C2E12|nr:ammonium transporter [Thiomicrospira microaerophila]UQB41546.1 ammonium transporter [Thiomicrospira microaerophila]
MEELQNHLNMLWILMAAAMVLFMQAGFTAIESGKTRAKNTINVALKNIMDFIVSIIAFWALGFGLMFGASAAGWFGNTGFFLLGELTPSDYSLFVFQATFAATAATIISGAVAERMKFMAYALVSLATVILIYPISGHWIWNDEGWLANMGMLDFAGSTVVHSLGAWVGLAGIIMLGARIGKFNQDGSANHLQGHNLVLAVLGVMILWFGWFGFNGGSLLEVNENLPRVILNTLLSASFAAGAVLIATLIINGHLRVEKLLTAVIAGLVGITASADIMTPIGAIFIGIGAGLIAYAFEYLMLKWRLDDPINVVASHGVAGVWGTLALAVFAPIEALPAGSVLAQLWIQLIGVVSVFIWGFGLGLVLFWTLKKLDWLRVPPEGEIMGLNRYEHGASSGVYDVMLAMKQMVESGKFDKRLEVEAGTDEGELAQAFNQLTEAVDQSIGEVNRVLSRVAQGDFSQRIETDLRGDLNKIKQAVNQSVTSINTTSQSLEQVMQGLYKGDFSVRMSDQVQGQLRYSVDQALGRLSNTMSEINQIMHAMSNGDFSQRINLELEGELLQVKQHVNDSMDHVSLAVNELNLVMNAQSQGNFSLKMRGQYGGELASLQTALDKSSDHLMHVLETMLVIADEVSYASNTVAEGSYTLNDMSANQATSLQQTRSTMMSISDEVKLTTEHAAQANQLVTEVDEFSQKSQASMQATIETIQHIQASSQGIQDIIGTIESIAFQTNLLALNAAVEAARAGEMGRGFAVVASEVRSLAQRSAEAAKDIRQLIENTVNQIEAGAQRVNQTGDKLSHMTRSINQVVQIINQVAQAAKNQTINVNEVVSNLNVINDMTQKTSEVAKSAQSATEGMHHQVSQLHEIMQFFDTKNKLKLSS